MDFYIADLGSQQALSASSLSPCVPVCDTQNPTLISAVRTTAYHSDLYHTPIQDSDNYSKHKYDPICHWYFLLNTVPKPLA